MKSNISALSNFHNPPEHPSSISNYSAAPRKTVPRMLSFSGATELEVNDNIDIGLPELKRFLKLPLPRNNFLPKENKLGEAG